MYQILNIFWSWYLLFVIYNWVTQVTVLIIPVKLLSLDITSSSSIIIWIISICVNDMPAIIHSTRSGHVAMGPWWALLPCHPHNLLLFYISVKIILISLFQLWSWNGTNNSAQQSLSWWWHKFKPKIELSIFFENIIV